MKWGFGEIEAGSPVKMLVLVTAKDVSGLNRTETADASQTCWPLTFRRSLQHTYTRMTRRSYKSRYYYSLLAGRINKFLRQGLILLRQWRMPLYFTPSWSRSSDKKREKKTESAMLDKGCGELERKRFQSDRVYHKVVLSLLCFWSGRIPTKHWFIWALHTASSVS